MEAYQNAQPAGEPKQDNIILKALLAAVGGALIGGVLAGTAIDRVAILLLYPIVTAFAANVACAYQKRQTGVILTILSLAPSVLAAVLFGSGRGIPMVAAAVAVPLGAVALFLVQHHKLGGFLSCAAVSAALILVIYCSLCLEGIISGAGAFASLEAWVKDGFVTPTQESISILLEEGAFTQEIADTFNEYLTVYLEAVPSITTGIICYCSCVLGTATVLMFFVFTRRHREELNLNAPGKFNRWTMPRSVTLPMMLLFIASTVLTYTGYSNAVSIYYTVEYLFLLPLTVMGLSMVAYLLSQIKRKKTMWNIIVFILIGVFFQLVQQVLMYIGMFEQLFRFRERRERALNHKDKDETRE